MILPPRRQRDEHPFVGYCEVGGLPIHLENLAGDTRSGTDRDGHEWSVVMHHHYGEIDGTTGVDGEPLDVYVGPNPDSKLVVIVHQNVPSTGRYDEDKAMLGFDSEDEALAAYRAQYDRPGFYGSHTTLTIDRLMDWCQDASRQGDKITKARFLVRVDELRKNMTGAPFVGPRGGLWADAEHTVHWTRTAHGHQADWVGKEARQAKAARTRRIKAAFKEFEDAVRTYRRSRTLHDYQAVYRALHEYGRATGVPLEGRDTFAEAAMRILRERGISIPAPPKAKRDEPEPEQGVLFRGLDLPSMLKSRGFGADYIARVLSL